MAIPRILAVRFFQWRMCAACFGCSLLGIGAVYLTLAQAPGAGTFHDDGIYLITAKALAEGQGYRITSIPGEPWQTKYPVLFPWVLSLVWRLFPSFPANLPWLRLVPLLATLAWLCLSRLLLCRLGASKQEAAVIVLLTAISPWVAFLSTSMMSESLFAAILTAGFLVMTRIHQGDGARAGALAAGLLAGAAVLTRMAGIAPAVAGFVWLALARRWVLSVQYLAGAATLTLPWFWWVLHQSLSTSLDSYYSARNYASWNIVGSYTWTEKLDVLSMNVIHAGLALGQSWGLHVAYPALILPVACVALAVIARGCWRTRYQPVVVLTVAYCAIHLAWVWPPLRFAVPVLPLLLWFAFLGMGRSPRLGCAAALLLFTVGGFRLSGVVAQAHEKGISWPSTQGEDWNQMARLLDWIARETPSDAVLTGNLDPVYYLFTGRKAVRAFNADPYLLYYNVRGGSQNPLGTVDEFRDHLLATKANYLVMTPAPSFVEVTHLRRLVSELSERFAGSLSPVAGSVGSGYVIYQVDHHRLRTTKLASSD